MGTNPLNSLLTAELQIILTPVNTFLTALQQPNVNYQTVLQDFAALQLAVIQDEPAIQSVGIQNIAADLQAALNNWVNGLSGSPATSGKSS